MVSRQVVTMANCIVGVSVLAMPFCFKQCGVVLASTMLMLSGIMTRTVCYFLLKASTITRRRTYELLAYDTFGQAGKLMVEISIIGFLIGTLIAFLVVMGDLGPEIMADVFKVENNASLRTIIMTALSLFVALPLGLLRNIDSLSSVSTVTMLFYMILVAKIFSEGMGPLWSGSFLTRIHYWRPAGVLQCIPIFSMALSCQTQIFSIYDSLPEPSLQKMNEVIRKAVNVCTLFYICVGFLGYIAFCTQNFGGNILLSFGPTWSTQMIKICFVLSIAFSFPLVIFPCRASLHSLIFRRVYSHHLVHDITTNYIPESRLKLLTVGIIAFTLFVGLMIPNIELVLGLVGSTTGSVICIIFPSVMFIRVTSKNTTERILAQAIFMIGVIVMVVTTYATLYAAEQAQVNEPAKIIEQPLTEIPIQLKINQPVAVKDSDLSRDVEKLIPKVVPDIPPALKDLHIHEDEEVKAPEKALFEKLEENESVKKVEPEKVEKKEVPIAETKQEPQQKQIVPPIDKAPPAPAQRQEEPVEEIKLRRLQEQRELRKPPLENLANNKVRPQPDPPLPQKKYKKLALLKNATLAAPRKSNVNQTLPVKPSADKMNQEDFLLQQLKEHEKEQKKLLEEQKEILAKLKQHQADDELKDQMRQNEIEFKNIPKEMNDPKESGEFRRFEVDKVIPAAVDLRQPDEVVAEKQEAQVQQDKGDENEKPRNVKENEKSAQVEEPQKVLEASKVVIDNVKQPGLPVRSPNLKAEDSEGAMPEVPVVPKENSPVGVKVIAPVEDPYPDKQPKPPPRSNLQQEVSAKVIANEVASPPKKVPAAVREIKPQNRDRDM